MVDFVEQLPNAHLQEKLLSSKLFIPNPIAYFHYTTEQMANPLACEDIF